MDPMSPHDLDLAEIAVSARNDRMLRVLAGVASANGPTYVVGLLVGGMTIYGRTADPKQMGAAVDAENVMLGERLKATGHEGWDAFIETVKNMWTDRFEKSEEDVEWLIEHIPAIDLDELPEEVARKVLRTREDTLTLADATILPPGDAPFQVPLMRIQIALVAAWWLMPTDAAGKAPIEHPRRT